MEGNEVLRRILDVLEITGISYMVVGSFASSYHGALRSTGDVDIVIDADPRELRKLTECLREREYYAVTDAALEAWRQRSMFNVIDQALSWKIDFIFVKPRAFSREEFRRRTRANFEGIQLVVATREDTIISSSNGRSWENQLDSSRMCLSC
jgi:predicted nucleotidyltransferase